METHLIVIYYKPLSHNLKAPKSLLNRYFSDTFAALKHPNYRLWFFGMLISVIGSWMQGTAQGYLIYDLTHSDAYLGYVGFIGGVPNWIFTIYAGVIADRISRRTLIMLTQSAQMILAFILAALTFTGLVQPWHIMVLAFLGGVTNAFDFPARQVFVNDLVPRADLTNAIALNATLFNGALIIGPAFGGIIYAVMGPGWCFTINGVSFLAVLAAVLMMRLSPFTPPKRVGTTLANLQEGFRYIRGDQMTQLLLAGVVVYAGLIAGVITLMPAWSHRVLGGDVTTNGYLLSARGVGALLGALLTATLGRKNIRGKLVAGGSLIMPLAILIFSLINILPTALFLMGVIGLCLVMTLNNTNAMVQTRTPDLLLGRVMGVYSLMLQGGMPLGSLLAGILASGWGEPATVTLFACVMGAFSLWVVIWKPAVRHME